jgi:hypothetical protein
MNRSTSAEKVNEPRDDLPQLVSTLWLSLANHLEATIDAIKLDTKLAASSLVALLVTGIVAAALFLGLWFLGMGLLFAGLTALQVPTVVTLLLIVLIQLGLLVFCHRFSRRLLANLDFQATRAALPGTAES